jgi:hypothetical protein
MPKTVLSVLLAAGLGLASMQPIAAATNERDTFNATKDTRAAEARKKADCDRQARARHFGVHLGQRSRFLKRCMGTR